jgi:hypothetical protein
VSPWIPWSASEETVIEAWWASIGTPLQVFYVIAFAASTVLVLQAILTLFGFEVDFDEGGGVGFLSLRSATAFFTGFGWGGVIALKAGWSVPGAILLGGAIGGALMGGVLALMRFLYGMRYSGNLDYANAVGSFGTVYLPVPGAMAGPGQIEVLVQGRHRVVQAFTRSPERIPNRARVRVVELLDPVTLMVEPLDVVAATPTPAAAAAETAPPPPAPGAAAGGEPDSPTSDQQRPASDQD